MADCYDQSDIPRLIREEHLALRTAARWLVSFLDEPTADRPSSERRDALRAFLDALRAELGAHFHHEEAVGGRVWATIEEAHRERLREEHALLLAWVEELRALLGDGLDFRGSLQSEQLERFLQLLERHEATERRIFLS